MSFSMSHYYIELKKNVLKSESQIFHNGTARIDIFYYFFFPEENILISK